MPFTSLGPGRIQSPFIMRPEPFTVDPPTPPDPALRAEHHAPPFSIGGAIDLATITRAHVLAVLEQHAGNKARAARALGINRRSLYRLLEKYEDAQPGLTPCS